MRGKLGVGRWQVAVGSPPSRVGASPRPAAVPSHPHPITALKHILFSLHPPPPSFLLLSRLPLPSGFAVFLGSPHLGRRELEDLEINHQSRTTLVTGVSICSRERRGSSVIFASSTESSSKFRVNNLFRCHVHVKCSFILAQLAGNILSFHLSYALLCGTPDMSSIRGTFGGNETSIWSTTDADDQSQVDRRYRYRIDS
ncbi:uncharacterized protein BO80DRAFT_5783 [Aspergillus ibericus CBS 121593]|uniref:Uncharacterized protein n=1 Tax=Aspergillus ibericus CBS 121593 TaxID=1448316 RepID=A0A395HGK6_9EURO|nr:hypothetical protein BO80DRAFT_5783 [Aspergillus ibericus CBS 121593]RAL06265.1 hypothetical protein BO80DRAFT_5783 [Aspergillus ibericus CBS 121593]